MTLKNKIVHILRERDDGEPESNGTGFLLECKEGIVLISAAHVADDESLCIALKENDPNSIYVLNGTRYKSKIQTIRAEDKKDWGIFVNEDVKNGLLKLGIKPFKEYATKGVPYFSVTGFPISANKNKHYKETKVIKNKPYQWTSTEASEEDYHKYNYESSENILISFNDGKGFYEDKPSEQAKFRCPKGMSGAPVTDGTGMLIGVFTGITEDRKFLVATRIETILDDLKNGDFEQVDLQ